MIAVVLLIAFVVAAGGVIGLWLTGYIQTTTETAETSTASDIACSATRISILTANRYCGNMSIIVSNSGPVTLESLNLLVSDGSRTVNGTHTGNVTPGQSVVIRVSIYPNRTTGLLSAPAWIYVTSPTCPTIYGEKTTISASSAPTGMANMDSFCMDKYEASRSDATDSSAGTSSIAASQQGVVLWASITQTAAKTACEAAGKHLCSNMEWQLATGTSSSNTTCPTDGNNAHTNQNYTYTDCTDDPTYDWGTAGGTDRCLTGTNSTWCNAKGICDLNGNVWEWADNFYGQGSYCDRGANGYVSTWDWSYNCPTAVSGSGSAAYGNDYYYYPNDAGDGAVRRGGNWYDGASAGCFAMDLGRPPSYSSTYGGFRCCR